MKKRIISSALALMFLLQTAALAAVTVSDVAFSGNYGERVQLRWSAFEAVFAATDGETLEGVEFITLPDTKEGMLQSFNGNDYTDVTATGVIYDSTTLDAISFLPADNFSGDATFTWQDNYTNTTDEKTVTITIAAKTVTAPVAKDATLTIEKNNLGTGTLTATDAENRTLTYAIVSDPTNGAVNLEASNGAFTYTPNADYVGVDTFTFQASADTVVSNTATVTVTITAAPDEIVPMAYADMTTHWAATSAGSLGTLGIVKGEQIGDHSYFRPDRAMTRGEFIMWICEMMGIKPTDNKTTKFIDDVPYWLGGYVNAAESEGFVKGYPVGDATYELRAEETLTRIEAIRMLAVAMELGTTSAKTPEFVDLDLVPGWGLSELISMKHYGIIQGDNGYIKPLAKMTRAEAAQMLFMSYKHLESQGTVSAQ